MPSNLEKLFNGQYEQHLASIANLLNDIGSSQNKIEQRYGLTEQLLASNRAAIELKQTLGQSLNFRTGNLDLKAFNQNLARTGKTLSQYRAELNTIGLDGEKAFSSLSRAIMTAEKPMLSMGKIANSLWGTLGNTIKWQASSALVQGVMKQVSSATSYVKQLDSSLNSIQIVTGQSSQHMANFAKMANQAARELQSTTNEYAKASLIYYQQGLSDKQVQDRVATTIKLANVSGQSAKVVSDQLTAVWNNFYDGTKSLEFYADAMAALGATTASSSSEIAKGLEKFAAIADSTGLSFEYASSALATVVANTRQSADSVGTSFRTLFSRLQGLNLGETLEDGTTLNKYSKALMSVGVNIKQANGELKNMDTILNELGVKWQALAQDEKVALAQTIGGARNYTGLMSLMDNWDDFTQNLKTAQNAQGTLQNQADIYAKSWEAASAHVRTASEAIYSNLLNDKAFVWMTNAKGTALDFVASMTNAFGGFAGTLNMLGALGTRVFSKQIGQGVQTVGYKVKDFFTGRKEIDRLRAEARNDLLTNTSISADARVDATFHRQMQNTNARQSAYESAVSRGAIAPYEQAIYQQMFALADKQTDTAVEKAQYAANIRKQTNTDEKDIVRRLNYERKHNSFGSEADENRRLALIEAADDAQREFDAANELVAEEMAALAPYKEGGAKRRELVQNVDNAKAALAPYQDQLNKYKDNLEKKSQRQTELEDALSQEGLDDSTRIKAQSELMQVKADIKDISESQNKYIQDNQIEQLQSNLSIAENALQRNDSYATGIGLRGLQEAMEMRDNAAQARENAGHQVGYFEDVLYARSDSYGQKELPKQVSEMYKKLNIGKTMQTLLSDLSIESSLTEGYTQTGLKSAADVLLNLEKSGNKEFLALLAGENSDAFYAKIEALKSLDWSNAEATASSYEKLQSLLVGDDDWLANLTEHIQELGDTALTEGEDLRRVIQGRLNLYEGKNAPPEDRERVKELRERIANAGGSDAEYQALLAEGWANRTNEEITAELERRRSISSMSQGLTVGFNTLSSVTMGVVSLANGVKILGDESATTMDKLGAAGTLLTGTGGAIMNIAQNAGEFSKKLGESGLLSKVSVGGLTGIMGGLALLAAGSLAVYNDRKANSTEGIIQNFSNISATGQQIYNQRQSEYEQVGTIQDQYKGLSNNISQNAIGTQDYYNNLSNLLALTSSAIDTYDLVYGEDYTFDSHGVPQISNETFEQIAKQKQQEALDASITNLQVGYAKKLLQSYEAGLGEYDKIALHAIFGTGKVSDSTVSFSDFAEGLWGKGEEINQLTTLEERAAYIRNSLQNDTGILSRGKDSTWSGLKVSIDDLKATFGVNNEEDLYTILADMSFQGTKPSVLSDYYTENYGKQATANLNSYIQGLASISASRLPEDVLNRDLIGQLFGQQFENNSELMRSIVEFIGKGTQGSIFETLGIGNSPEKWYEIFSGKSANKDWTDEELSYYTTQEMLKAGFNDPSIFLKYNTGINASQITGLSQYVEELGELNLPSLSNYTLEGARKLLSDMYDQDENGTVFLNRKKELLDSVYESFSKQYQQTYKDIQEAILLSFEDTSLDGSLDESAFHSQVQAIADNLTYRSLQTVYNGLAGANSVGTETARVLQELILNDREKNGNKTELSAELTDLISDFDFNNNLNSIYNNTQMMRFRKTEQEKNQAEKLLLSQIESVGREKGLFKMLYNSSGFEDVMENLRFQFESTGQITAANIEKLANKQENLNELLRIGAEHLEGATINSAGLASVFEEISRGTISGDRVSSNLISALSISQQSASLDQQGLTYAKNLDLGSSGEDFLDYFQDMGKAYYQAEKSNWGFNSEQMRNLISLLGNDEIKSAYYQANRSGEIKFPQLMQQMPSYFTDFLDTMAGKKGKGGGGPGDVFGFLNKAITKNLDGGEMTEEDWAALGFRINKDGSIDVGSGMTQEMFVDNLTKLLIANGYDEESAKQLATVAGGMAHTSGNIGAVFDDTAAEIGLNYLLGKDLKSEEELADLRRKNEGDVASEDMYKTADKRRIVTDSDLTAYFKQNQQYLKEKYGIEDVNDFINWFQEENQLQGNNFTYLKDQHEFLTSQAGTGITISDIMKGQTGKEYSSQEEAFQDFSDLASDFGALTENGTWNYDKLLELVEGMGGSEANLAELIQQNLDQFTGSLIGRDANGNEIRFGAKGYETWQKYSNALKNGTAIDEYITPYIANDPMAQSVYNGMAGMYYKNENGDWELDIDGSKRQQAAKNNQLRDLLQQRETARANGDSGKEQVIQDQIDALIDEGADESVLEEFESPEEKIQRLAEARNEALKFGAGEAAYAYQKELEKIPEYVAAKEEYDAAMNTLLGNEKGTTTTESDSKNLDAAIQAQNELEETTGVPTSPPTRDPTREFENLDFTNPGVVQMFNPSTMEQLFNAPLWDYSEEDLKNKDLLKELNLKAMDAIFSNSLYDQYKAQAFDENGKGLPNALSPYEFLQQMQQQYEQQQAFQNFQNTVEGSNGSLAPILTPDQQAELDLLKAEADNAQTVLDTYDDEIMAGETGTGVTRGEALGISKEEAEANALNAQEKVDLYTYQNTMSPAERLAAITDAKNILDNQGADKLTPFQKFLMQSIGELVDYNGIMAEAAESEEGSDGKKKQAHVDEKTGELVDEDGNPIEMPEGSQPQGGSTSGRESGDAGTNGGTRSNPGNGPGNSGLGPGAAPGSHIDDPNGKGGIFRGADGKDYRFVYHNGNPIASLDGNGDPIPADTENNKFVDLANNAASGQNNARLLAYASGKEGHIAVTGELGPELRVKSDGSMDILGKKGREYAWVEPDDKIYTASQSAGILKSNKIPGLEGLAKGINNYIPGYYTATSDWGGSSSSGGGGGGGSEKSRGGGGGAAAEKDPRYDPQTLKIRDILERYYTILQQIDNITKAVERFSKVADRAWGRERIRAIEHQNELQQKQYEAQKKYISEIEEYLDTDQSTMTTMIKEFVDGWNKAVDENTDPNNTMERISWAGAQFDQDGILTNYREFVEKLVEQYNQNAASANQETQYKFQEQIKDIQMYTDTLNLYEEQINALEDIKNAILDTAVKVVTYEVEYKLELSGDTDRILNFQADKYKDDVYQAAKYLELLDQRADLTRKNLETVTEGIMKTLGNYAGENMRVGALHTLDELGVYGTNKFEIPEELLEELDEEDEEDAEKLKELQAERSRNITKQIGAWIDEAYATHKDDVEKIEKMLSFSSEEGAGDFTYDENWRDTYDSWEDYYNEVINKTDNDTERFIDNYEEIVGKLNGLVDFQKVRAQIGDWLEELRMKDAEAAAEIDKIVRYTEDGQIANYSDVLEKLNEANVKLNDEFIELLYTDQDAFFEAMSDFQNNPGWVDFTTEHKDQLTNWMDAIYQYLESLQDTYKQTIEQLGDSVKATSKQMDSAIDEFDYYESIYKEFKNIVDLTNREMTDITKGYFDALNSKSMDNAINKIKGTVTNYHLLQGELEEITRQYEEMQARADAATGEEQIFLQQSADKLKEQMDIANSQFEDAHKNYLSAWEDALNKMSEIYKNTLEEASKEFERSFSPLFNTLALLQAQFDREKALGDLYVDNYQRIHDLSKLNRDIAASIIDTDNLKGKERLRDLQAEINQLQEDGTELSEYDLDILDKKYKLELARQALEDAKDAKSMVRLARDNNGNWSYVYTANQDDVDKAEQDYEDAIREMEQANEDYIDNIQEQILQVQQEAQQALIALQPEDFATYDDYLAAVQAIQSSMYDTLNFLHSQINNAFGNNIWLDPYIVNRYGVNDHDLTTNYKDTTLAKLLDSDDLDRSINHMKDNFENNLMSPALEAYLTYSQKQQQVYEAAEHNMATIGEDFGKEMEYVAKMSDNEVQIVEKLSDRVQDAFEDMANVVDEKTSKHIAEMDKLVSLYEKLVEAITRVKELSGENLPIEGGQFIGKIDSWAEIQRLNKELAEHGDFRVLEDLTELNPEDLQDRKEAMEKATEKIGEWMETLLTDAVDEETKTAIQDMVEKDENGLITNYKQVISKLAQIEKTDENKDTLKEIKKWRATEQKAMYTSPRQVYKENEGLYTNFIADDQFTKDYISWITDQLLYKQMKTASADGVRDTERAEIETYFNAHGGVWVQKGDIEEFFDNWTELQAWLNANAYVESSGGGGDTPWTTGGFSQHWLDQNWSGGYLDTGGYTGRWQFADTGMYTGEWPDGSTRRNGRLAWLHQKELVLNAHDTENFLDAMSIVRQLDNLTNWMANGLGDLIMPNVSTEASELEQNVHIEAEFPNVTNHSEIEQAFNNLVNMASQYANRK